MAGRTLLLGKELVDVGIAALPGKITTLGSSEAVESGTGELKILTTAQLIHAARLCVFSNIAVDDSGAWNSGRLSIIEDDDIMDKQGDGSSLWQNRLNVEMHRKDTTPTLQINGEYFEESDYPTANRHAGNFLISIALLLQSRLFKTDQKPILRTFAGSTARSIEQLLQQIGPKRKQT